MINFWGLIFAMIYMLFFVKIFLNAYNFGMKDKILTDSKNRFMFSVFVFAGACLCYYIVIQNRTVYTWDYSHYWTQSFTQMRFLFSDPLLAVMRLGGTIWFSDYNSILPTFIALPLKLFGITFVRYVMVNYIFFIVPLCFILLAVMKKITGRNHNLLLIPIILMFNPLFRPLLNGYIDCACIIPAVIAMILLKDYDALSFSHEQIKRDVYISFMLLCTFMFRRYFVFHVQGYMCALALLSLYSVIKSHRGLKNALLNILVIGIFAFSVMLIFFAPMMFRIMSRNYSELYISYNAPLIRKMSSIMNYYGYFTMISALLGVILPAITGKMRRYSFFCAVSFVVSALTFFYVQAMGMQHFYILLPQLFILSCIGIIQATELAGKKLIPSLCIVIMLAGFVNCYFPSVRTVLAPVSKVFSVVHNPLIRNDIHELNELADYFNELTNGTDKGVYLCSAGVLNYSVMESLRKPYEAMPVHNLLKTCQTDLSDGFPSGFLEASVVAVTRPVTSKQEVIAFLSREIMNDNSPVGKHFKRNERTFMLDEDVEVIIYEKVSEFEHDDLEYMAAHFSAVYPKYDHIFAKRILGETGVAGVIGDRYDPRVVKVLRWLLEKKIFTPEQLAAASNRPVYEIRHLIEN